MFPNVLATTATVVGIVATLVAALVAVLTYRQGRAKRARPTAELQPIISSTVEQLASAVRVKWRTEEGLRRIHDPFPLPVRWTNAHETLFDHWPNILGTLVSARSHGLDLSGSLDQIVNTFKRLPSGRLVVLGDAGSGKTILALRFVLDSLRYRNKDDPVPVVISMGSWNPNVDSFRDWIISRLIDQHPGLAKSVDADTLAPMLLDSDQILPVLDGFDEIAESLRPAALGALNLTNSPLILTSRPAEYLAAVDAADVLTRAAAVVLQGLTLDDLASYLPLTTRKTEIRPGYLETKWDPVIDRLRREQNNPAARIVQSALSSPLMVGLARVIYSDARDHDPSEMFDRSKFATDRAIEDHLLDAFIPAAYKHYPQARRSSRRHRNWEPAKAELWLGNIAVHLEHLGTRDLAWWQLRDSVPRITRMLVGAAIGAIGAGVLLGTVFNPWVAIGLGATFGAAVTAASQCRQPIRSLPGVHGRGMDVITILAGGVPGGLVGTLLGTSVGGAKGLVANTLAGATSATRFNPTVGLAVGVAAGFGFALAGRFTPAWRRNHLAQTSIHRTCLGQRAWTRMHARLRGRTSRQRRAWLCRRMGSRRRMHTFSCTGRGPRDGSRCQDGSHLSGGSPDRPPQCPIHAGPLWPDSLASCDFRQLASTWSYAQHRVRFRQRPHGWPRILPRLHCLGTLACPDARLAGN